MTTGKALLGVLAGIAAGAVMGMLIAPDRDKVRKNIFKKSEDLGEAINDKIDAKFEELLKTISGKVKKAESAVKANGSLEV